MPNPFGAWWSSDEDDLIVLLGAEWTRVVENNFGTTPWDGHSEKAALYKAVGRKICLTLIWDDDGTPPPTTSDYADLRAFVNDVLDDVEPDKVSFGNEVLATAFWDDPDPVNSYLAAATAVAEECALRDIPFLGGAIHSRLLMGSYRWYLNQEFGSPTAEAFADQVTGIASNQAEEDALNGGGFNSQRNALLEPYLAGLAATGAEAVLFHCYQEEFEFLDDILDYIEGISGLPAVTDEWGLFVQDADVVAGCMEVFNRRCAMCIAFSMNIWTDPYDAGRQSQMLNVVSTETLTENGQAFADFIESQNVDYIFARHVGSP